MDENKDKTPEQEKKPEQEKEQPTPTIEELVAKVKALESDLARQKASTSNASSDAAEWKRKYRETLDEQTRTAQEQAEALETLRNENAAYKEREKTANYTAKLMGAGYDAATAAQMAAALPADLGDEFFAGQKTFLENQKKSYEAARMGGQPGLSGGTDPNPQDPPEDTSKMSDAEYYKKLYASRQKG